MLILRWRHNGRDSVSSHQPHDCLLNRLFRPDQRKHQISASLAFVKIIHRGPLNSPRKRAVTRKMIPFDDVIMCIYIYIYICHHGVCMRLLSVGINSNEKSRQKGKLFMSMWLVLFFIQLGMHSRPSHIIPETFYTGISLKSWSLGSL